jgi:PIN domain nuclease of toxin-antitoxin system
MRASPAAQQAYEIHMLAVKWYEIETEKKAERILLELDVQSQYVAFMKNLQVKIESVKANGGTIKHAELLASLPAGNVVASISGIAAAAV